MSDEMVLVVDDSRDIRQFVVNYVLKPGGYKHVEADNGEEALRLIKTRAPDLMVTDLQMPHMDGLDLLYRLREDGIELPVILMTFHGSEEIAIEVFRLGVRDYLIKPFTDEEMYAAIERAMSEVRLRKERDQLLEEMVTTNRTLERQLQELEALFDVGRMLTGQPDTVTATHSILEMAHTLLHSSRATLLMVSPDGKSLIKRAEIETGGELKLFNNPVHNKLAWDCIEQDTPLASKPAKDPTTKRSVIQICAPLIIEEQGLGVLSLHLPPGDVSEHQLSLLNTLADYAAIGLEQARLLDLANNL